MIFPNIFLMFQALCLTTTVHREIHFDLRIDLNLPTSSIDWYPSNGILDCSNVVASSETRSSGRRGSATSFTPRSRGGNAKREMKIGMALTRRRQPRKAVGTRILCKRTRAGTHLLAYIPSRTSIASRVIARAPPHMCMYIRYRCIRSR